MRDACLLQQVVRMNPRRRPPPLHACALFVLSFDPKLLNRRRGKRDSVLKHWLKETASRKHFDLKPWTVARGCLDLDSGSRLQAESLYLGFECKGLSNFWDSLRGRREGSALHGEPAIPGCRLVHATKVQREVQSSDIPGSWLHRKQRLLLCLPLLLILTPGAEESSIHTEICGPREEGHRHATDHTGESAAAAATE